MRYKIIEIHQDDAYFISKEHLIGIEVEPSDEWAEAGEEWSSGGWRYIGDAPISYEYGGEMITYKPGETMYFYKVKLEKIVKQETI